MRTDADTYMQTHTQRADATLATLAYHATACSECSYYSSMRTYLYVVVSGHIDTVADATLAYHATACSE